MGVPLAVCRESAVVPLFVGAAVRSHLTLPYLYYFAVVLNTMIMTVSATLSCVVVLFNVSVRVCCVGWFGWCCLALCVCFSFLFDGCFC